MSEWKCRDCGAVATVKDDDDLFWWAMDHVCQRLTLWQRIKRAATSGGEEAGR